MLLLALISVALNYKYREGGMSINIRPIKPVSPVRQAGIAFNLFPGQPLRLFPG